MIGYILIIASVVGFIIYVANTVLDDQIQFGVKTFLIALITVQVMVGIIAMYSAILRGY